MERLNKINCNLSGITYKRACSYTLWQADTFKEDFESECRDRVEAHSQLSSLRTCCEQQLRTLQEQLNEVSRGKGALIETII